MQDYRVSRTYVRTNKWTITAKVSESESGAAWQKVKVPEISAGGLLLQCEKPHKKGDHLWLKLHIDPTLPGIGELDIKVQVVIRSERDFGAHNAYGAEFTRISSDDRVRLDELIRRALEGCCQADKQLDHLDT